MINVPKSVCQSCVMPNVYQDLQPLAPIETCPPCESDKYEVTLEPIVSFLCPCPPPPEPVIIPLKRKFKTTTVTLCFKEFVLAVSTTKFCETGPKCHPSV
jgi:hypothetical protein